MADTHPCETCPLRRKAEEKQGSFFFKLWKWHTTWCPGWKSYQKWLAEHQPPSA
jgi:hypothetical protein